MVAGLQTMVQADKAQHPTTVVDVVDREALAAGELQSDFPKWIINIREGEIQLWLW